MGGGWGARSGWVWLSGWHRTRPLPLPRPCVFPIPCFHHLCVYWFRVCPARAVVYVDEWPIPGGDTVSASGSPDRRWTHRSLATNCPSASCPLWIESKYILGRFSSPLEAPQSLPHSCRHSPLQDQPWQHLVFCRSLTCCVARSCSSFGSGRCAPAIASAGFIFRDSISRRALLAVGIPLLLDLCHAPL